MIACRSASAGSAGDHDYVGYAGGCQRGIDQRRRGVDHDQVGPTVARGIKYELQPSRLSRDHHRAVSFAQGAPDGRAPLRVQVDHDGTSAGALVRDGQGGGDRRFAAATLPCHQGDRPYAAPVRAQHKARLWLLTRYQRIGAIVLSL